MMTVYERSDEHLSKLGVEPSDPKTKSLLTNQHKAKSIYENGCESFVYCAKLESRPKLSLSGIAFSDVFF